MTQCCIAFACLLNADKAKDCHQNGAVSVLMMPRCSAGSNSVFWFCSPVSECSNVPECDSEVSDRDCRRQCQSV